MKKVCAVFFAVFLMLFVIGLAQANENDLMIGEKVSVTGVVVVMEDGTFLDEGTNLFLLIDMEDPVFQEAPVEVLGEYLVIDGQPAIKVQEITILDELPAGGDSEMPADNNG
ncbi:MAG: hypothetical protein JEY79_03550 [Pseudodesulfovibrio sp.]|nr:hypothetical protein [Pseudodesulfovibrio sp.]